MSQVFRPGEIVFHLPPDQCHPTSGPMMVSRLIHTDPEGTNHYLVLPDMVFEEIELVNATAYLLWRDSRMN